MEIQKAQLPLQSIDPENLFTSIPINGDWKSQLQPDIRETNIIKIMEFLKRHLSFSGHDGLLELKKIAVRLEEESYTAAIGQSDYLKKIAEKMFTIAQSPMGKSPWPTPGNSNQNPANSGWNSHQVTQLSPQIDQQNMPTPIPKAGTPLQSSSSPFIVPSPSTPLAPSPMLAETEKVNIGVLPLSHAGANGHQQATVPSAPAQSLAIGTPGISASPLLAEFTSPDGSHGIGDGKSTAVEQPHERLIRAVKSISSKALTAAVSDISSVVSMVDRVAGSAPGNGSRAAVGEDLVAMTKCRLQAKNFFTQEGPPGSKKMRRYTSVMPSNVVSSAGSVHDSFRQINYSKASDLESLIQQQQQQHQQQQQQNLLQQSQNTLMQPTMIQSPPLSNLQQMQQSSTQHSTQTMLAQHSQPIRQQQLAQQHTQQMSMIHPQTSLAQQPILTSQQQQQQRQPQQQIIGQPPPSGTNIQQNQMMNQPNNIHDMQQKSTQLQRMIGQPSNNPNLQQQLLSQQGNLSNLHQQLISKQNNFNGLQQPEMIGIQSNNSGMPSNQQNVHMLQQSRVTAQQPLQQCAGLISTQGQQSQQMQLPQPAQLQQQIGGLQHQGNTLHRTMQQRLQTTSRLLHHQNVVDPQKQLFQPQMQNPNEPTNVN